MEVWQSPVYCTCLENRRVEMLREFESHRFRQFLKGVVMSNEESKVKHSKRIHKTETAVKKQVDIAKQYGMPVKEPHRLAKKHALNCGDPNCVMCGNPRKFFKEKTIQEKRLEQSIDD
jgi:hypothetical protein